MPRVSVIMPAYNVARFIDEAIRSVLAQERVSFELLIADDASTDRTWQRIARYLEDRRVRAWRLRSRQGAAAARNFLIARARGRYISICDADDVMLPGNLAHSARIVEDNPEVGVVYGDVQRIHSTGHRGPVRHIFGPHEAWDLLGEHVWNGGALIRRSLIRRVGGYRSLSVFQDLDLALRLAERAQFRSHGRGVLYLYRRRKGSISSQALSLKRRVFRWILQDTLRRRYGRRLGLVQEGVLSR